LSSIRLFRSTRDAARLTVPTMSIFDAVFDPESPLSRLDDTRLPVGDEDVILARWTDGDRGAVFTVSPALHRDPSDGLYSTIVTSFERQSDSRWETVGAGGATWSNFELERPDIPPQEFSIFGSGLSSSDGWTPAHSYGFCGADIVSIECDNGGRIATGQIESPIGAFVVVWDGDSPVVITFVDRFDGRHVFEPDLP
jgi:hypothetical protein